MTEAGAEAETAAEAAKGGVGVMQIVDSEAEACAPNPNPLYP